MSKKKSNRLYAIAMSVFMLQTVAMDFTLPVSANSIDYTLTLTMS